MTESYPDSMCPHARPSWKMCPHCLGINTAEATIIPKTTVVRIEEGPTFTEVKTMNDEPKNVRELAARLHWVAQTHHCDDLIPLIDTYVAARIREAVDVAVNPTEPIERRASNDMEKPEAVNLAEAIERRELEPID